MSYYRRYRYSGGYSRPRYSNDEARFLNSRFDSTCPRCKGTIKAGDIIVKPRNQRLWFCRPCGVAIDANPAAFTPPPSEYKLENPAIADGRYAVVDGATYRVYRFRSVKGGDLDGFQKIGMRDQGATRWTWFAFSRADGTPKIWRNVSYLGTARIDQMITDVAAIKADPAGAGLAYAIRENECFKCGKKLIVPASVYNGMGETCARRSWKKADAEAAKLAGIIGGRETAAPVVEPGPGEDGIDEEEDVDVEFNEAWAERGEEEQVAA